LLAIIGFVYENRRMPVDVLKQIRKYDGVNNFVLDWAC
jgi:hypothetical protein